MTGQKKRDDYEIIILQKNRKEDYAEKKEHYAEKKNILCKIFLRIISENSGQKNPGAKKTPAQKTAGKTGEICKSVTIFSP